MTSYGIHGSLGAPQLMVLTTETKERAVVSPQNVPSVGKQNSIDQHVQSTSDGVGNSDEQAVSRGGVVTPFPWKLHDMLESVDEEGCAHIVSWQPHGRCFAVHKPREFVELIKKYFNQSKLASFQRQLNLYGFHRLTTGRDKGSYYHKDFLRGHRHLCTNMTRHKVKGTKVRRAMAPALEPQFYSMPFMPTKNGEVKPLPSTADARRLMRTVSLENVREATNDICFFEGMQFHFFDKSMVIPPSECNASSLKRESNVIQTWRTVIE